MDFVTRRYRHSLGADALYLTGSKVITLLISMVNAMLLSRFRTVEEYGSYSQLLLVVNLAVQLLMLGLPNSINYFLSRAESKEKRQIFLSVYYTLNTLLSIVIGLILLLSIPAIESYFHNDTLRRFWYFLALYPWTLVTISSVENVLVVYSRTDLLITYRLISSISVLMVLVISQICGYGFSEYVALFVIINCMLAGAVYSLSSKLSGGLSVVIDREIVRSLLAFSVPIGLATVVGTLNVEIDKLLIGHLLDTEQLAIYSNAARELPLAIVASSITAVLLPHITQIVGKGEIEDAIDLWNESAAFSFALICPIVAVLFVYARDALVFLYSDKYIEGEVVFRIYTLNLLLRCTYFGMLLNACGKTRAIFYCSVLTLIVNSVLNPLSFALFGIAGPALASFVSLLLSQATQLLMTAKVTHVSYSQIFPWKKCFAITGRCLCLGIILFYLKLLCNLDLYVGELIESLLLGATGYALFLLSIKRQILSGWKALNRHAELIG